MKLVSTLVVAVLLFIAAAWWLAEPEDESNASQAAAVSGGFDASQQTGGNGETPQQAGLRQRDIPSEDSADHRDVGSDSATPAPTGIVLRETTGTESASADG